MHQFGVRSDATDDWDDQLDWPDELTGDGHASIYHEFNPPEWTGPTGFYRTDHKAKMDPGDSKTWGPIHVWAEPGSELEDTMYFSIRADSYYKPPADWVYTLELISVPDGVEGGPPVGTQWLLRVDGNTMTVPMPFFESIDGMDAFQFTVSATPVPEPTSPVLVLAAGLGLLRRR
ncbi:MAG: PEP-CTERM sorting domain-containing protein [Phycisphaerae bacterium]|jgi:hypothetical protein